MNARPDWIDYATFIMLALTLAVIILTPKYVTSQYSVVALNAGKRFLVQHSRFFFWRKTDRYFFDGEFWYKEQRDGNYGARGVNAKWLNKLVEQWHGAGRPNDNEQY